jgi:N-dimethylarginine dimethylaminohydrolase
MNDPTLSATTRQSEVAPIQSMLLKHVREAWIDQAHVDTQWQSLTYVSPPDFQKALDEYDALVELIRGFGIEVAFLPEAPHKEGMGLDSVYVRDASLVTDAGVILCNMGKDARANEPGQQGDHFTVTGVQVLGAIGGSGRIEGGDVAWLKEDLLGVARGYRTNDDGIGQLRALLDPEIRIEVMHCPHYRGPGDVFHLMSVISPIADDLALVYSPLMSVPFREMILANGIKLVEVPEAEFDSLGGNVLAVAPRVAVIPKGNPVTVSRLRAAGTEVFEFEAGEICLKGCGGPTCLTRPLERLRSA